MGVFIMTKNCHRGEGGATGLGMGESAGPWQACSKTQLRGEETVGGEVPLGAAERGLGQRGDSPSSPRYPEMTRVWSEHHCTETRFWDHHFQVSSLGEACSHSLYYLCGI